MKSLNRLNPNIIIYIIYGLLYDSVVNIWKPFAVKFIKRLGGDAFMVSLFYSAPGLVAFLALLPSAVLIGRMKDKKRITIAFFALSRTILLIAAFVPFLPEKWRPVAFVVLISFMNFPDAVSQTALQGFLGNVLGGRVRAQAIALRNKFGNVMIPIVTVVTGLILYFIPKNDAQTVAWYQIFYGVAFLVGMVEIFVFSKFKEPPLPPGVESLPSPPPMKLDMNSIGQMMRNKKFLHFLVSTTIFQFFWQAGWPLCSLYQIENLRANELWLGIFAVGSGVGAFISAAFWNRYIAKHGNPKALAVAAFSMVLNLIAYPLSPNVGVMTLVSIYGGFSTLGFSTCILNGLLEATPDENRIVYIGVYNALTNFTLFLSPILAVTLLYHRVGIHWALYIIGLGRLLSAAYIYYDQWRGQKRGRPA